MKIALSDLATLVGGVLLSGRPDLEITGFASLKEASPGDLSLFHDARYQQRLLKTRAAAVLVPQDLQEPPPHVACIAVADPSRSFEVVVEKYGLQPVPFTPGVHATAVIDPSVKLDPSQVSIGAHVVIEAGAEIGAGTEIGAGCFIGRNVKIGCKTKLFANVTVQAECILGNNIVLHSGVVIGADGFGYEFHQGRHRKIRQVGFVQIDNDVEVGANTTIDRARFGRTWIGEGTKIDNLVQIGHNVTIGKHCVIVGCAAIAGSAVVGDYVVIAAQVGISGHVIVGSQSTLAGRAGVTRDLPAGGTYFGFPAVDANQEKRRLVAARRLPQLLARVKKLEEQVAAAQAAVAS